MQTRSPETLGYRACVGIPESGPLDCDLDAWSERRIQLRRHIPPALELCIAELSQLVQRPVARCTRRRATCLLFLEHRLSSGQLCFTFPKQCKLSRNGTGACL